MSSSNSIATYIASALELRGLSVTARPSNGGWESISASGIAPMRAEILARGDVLRVVLDDEFEAGFLAVSAAEATSLATEVVELVTGYVGEKLPVQRIRRRFRRPELRISVDGRDYRLFPTSRGRRR